MGLTDNIRCQYPLPDEEAQDKLFQTKRLGRTRARYLITEDGRFARRYIHHRGAQTLDEWDVDLHWRGPVHFYTGDQDYWYDYYAYFEDGDLQWIKRTADVPEAIVMSSVQ